MNTIEQLQEILDIKNDIKNSIESRGGEVSNFSTFASAIDELPAGDEREHITLYVGITTSEDSITESHPASEWSPFAIAFNSETTISGPFGEVQILHWVPCDDPYYTNYYFDGEELDDMDMVWEAAIGNNKYTEAQGSELVATIVELGKSYIVDSVVDVSRTYIETTHTYDDVEDGVEYCDNCGSELVDGMCTNPDCPNSPDYVEPEE